MPYNLRSTMKRDLGRAGYHIDQAENRIATVGQNYKEKYPEVYQSYCDLIGQLEDLKAMIKKAEEAI